MLELSDRERQIVFLLYSKSNTNAASIASIFSVSEKTIRNDIKSINNLCKVNLIVSNKKGFSINPEHESILADIPLNQQINNENNQILFELLSHERIDIYTLADLLNISDTTLVKHLSSIRSFLKKYDLNILRKNNDLILIGSSRSKRSLYIDMMLDEAGTNFYDPTNFQEYFKNINLKIVTSTFQEILKKHNYIISDFYLNHFLLNLYTILNFDFIEDMKLPTDLNKDIFDLAVETNKLLNVSKINKTNSIYNSLLGVLNTQNVQLSNFEKDIRSLTENVFKKYSLNIDIDEFLSIFSRHIHDMIIRCRHMNSVQSDGGLSMKESCFFIYDVAVSLANEISKKYKISINENEISLISMHIGFLIEKSIDQEIQNDELNILFYISSYITDKSFIENIKQAIPYHSNITVLTEVNDSLSLSKYDLLITTSKLKLSIPVNQCIISSLFNSEDKLKIIDSVNKVMKVKKKEKFKTLFQLYFNANNFFINTGFIQREDVLKFLCNNLETQKIVNKDFKSSVFLREAIASTDIAGMYAIPHAMDFIAKKTIISVFINPKGIEWGNSSVKIVFLSAINRKNVSSLRILYDFIIDMVSRPSCYSKLIQAKNIQEFANYLFEE